LVDQLRLAGHAAEEMALPFSWDPAERLVKEMLLARGMRIVGVDRVIALKFPAYMVPVEQPRERRVTWLLHQYRQAYDLWDAGQSNIPPGPRGEAIRDMIRIADEEALREVRHLFAVSEAAKRLRRHNGIEAETLSAPLNDPELFTGGEAGPYILASGRVGDAKRQALLVRALRHAPQVRLVVAGPPDSPGEGRALRALAARVGVEDRLTLDLRFLPRKELAALVNNATAVAYLPFEEDSVGYVTMEAFAAGKPVLTSTDSGGVLDIVRKGETGLVTAPAPAALGEAMARLMANPARSAAMGAAGRQALDAMGLTWDRTLARLLA
jgi:glycosyltransferase involved in cell wall biosynthesis